ncbi:hypothetical protein RL74_19165, partial [Pseudomonas fluorescens]
MTRIGRPMLAETRNHPDDRHAIENLHQQHSERFSDQLIAFQDRAYAMGLDRGAQIAKGGVTLAA